MLLLLFLATRIISLSSVFDYSICFISLLLFYRLGV